MKGIFKVTATPQESLTSGGQPKPTTTQAEAEEDSHNAVVLSSSAESLFTGQLRLARTRMDNAIQENVEVWMQPSDSQANDNDKHGVPILPFFHNKTPFVDNSQALTEATEPSSDASDNDYEEDNEGASAFAENSGNDHPTSRTRRDKYVSFGTVSIRLYPVVPDDNPSVTGLGPAMALGGWKYNVLTPTSLDEYEATRVGSRRWYRTSASPKTAKHKNVTDSQRSSPCPIIKIGDSTHFTTASSVSLKLTPLQRRKRLMEHGATTKELQEWAKRTQKYKTRRAKTNEALCVHGKGHDQRQEGLEQIQRFLFRVLRLRKTTAESQAELWKQAAAAAAENKHSSSATPPLPLQSILVKRP